MSEALLVPFNLHARMSVVSQIRQDRLTRPEMFPFVAHVNEDLAEGSPAALKTELEQQLSAAFIQTVIRRLQQDSRLRQKFGKTKWIVKIHEYTYKRM